MNAYNSLLRSLLVCVVTLHLIVLWSRPVFATPIVIAATDFVVKMEILQDLPLATPLQLRVNVKVGEDPIKDIVFTFTSGATPVPAADIAAMLAAAINAKAGAGTVSVSGTTITILPEHSGFGVKTADTDPGYLGGSVTLAQFLIPTPTPFLFTVGPDPNTGSFVAASPGTMILAGPGPLNAALNIASGTSGLDIATLFANTLNSAGYDVNPLGASIFFGLPSPGTFSMRVDGTGLEYGLFAPVPEPSVLVLFGTGMAGLMLRGVASFRRRRGLRQVSDLDEIGILQPTFPKYLDPKVFSAANRDLGPRRSAQQGG